MKKDAINEMLIGDEYDFWVSFYSTALDQYKIMRAHDMHLRSANDKRATKLQWLRTIGFIDTYRILKNE